MNSLPTAPSGPRPPSAPSADEQRLAQAMGLAPLPDPLPPVLAQRLDVAGRAFVRLDLDIATTGACGADRPPAWWLDPLTPEVLVGVWPIQVETHSTHPPSYRDDTLSIELWFREGTAWLAEASTLCRSTGSSLGRWPDGFIEEENARAIRAEGDALRAASDAVTPAAQAPVPGRPRSRL